MKYLLSLLILFSSLSFSKLWTYMICDLPYTFYADKNERILIDFDSTKVKMESLSYSGFNIINRVYDDLTESNTHYYWNGSGWSLNRTTLMLNDSRKCKEVELEEFTEAKIDLIDITYEISNKRKI